MFLSRQGKDRSANVIPRIPTQCMVDVAKVVGVSPSMAFLRPWQSDRLSCLHPWMDQLVCPLWCPSWKGTLLWDAYIPLKVAGVITAPVSSTLGPRVSSSRFIYIHFCFPEKCAVNPKGLCWFLWLCESVCEWHTLSHKKKTCLFIRAYFLNPATAQQNFPVLAEDNNNNAICLVIFLFYA